MEKTIKAVVLISGGLDSTLAAKLTKDLGVKIVALNFKTPFCLCDRKKSAGCYSQSLKVALELGLELKVINASEEFFKIIENPPHGYGSNMNPCIDCRILMLRKAKEFMQEIGASFVVTGEVLGQRPMSQHKKALKIIEKESGLEGLVLRPLSARLLDETIPEQKGWIERNKLLAINGRTRKPQIDLARAFNIRDYPCAAGGCLLTDIQFAKRIRDLIARERLNINNVGLLKIGRHFRITEKVRLVVGRDEKENQLLEKLAKEGDYLFMPSYVNGPSALTRGVLSEDLINLSCRIVCRYCDLNGSKEAEIVYHRFPKEDQLAIKAFPLAEDELSDMRI